MKLCLAVLLAFGYLSLTTASNGYKWSQWFDKDDPTKKEDHETLANIRGKWPKRVCKNPVAIEARLTDDRFITQSKNKLFAFSASVGLRCRNVDQPGKKKVKCKDFKVRWLCKTDPDAPDAKWTKWLNRDKPTFKEDHETFQAFKDDGEEEVSDCVPIATNVLLADGSHISVSGNKVHMSASGGFRCVNSENEGMCMDYQVQFLCLPDPNIP